MPGTAWRASDVAMMTKRSNHMPTLMRQLRPTTIHGFVRHFLNQKNCGTMTLQLTIMMYAHEYSPRMRLRNVNHSASLPEYQAMKSSIEYAPPTIMPVAIMILH